MDLDLSIINSITADIILILMFLASLLMVYIFRILFASRVYLVLLVISKIERFFKQGCHFHKLSKAFSKSYHRYSESKF